MREYQEEATRHSRDKLKTDVALTEETPRRAMEIYHWTASAAFN